VESLPPSRVRSAADVCLAPLSPQAGQWLSLLQAAGRPTVEDLYEYLSVKGIILLIIVIIIIPQAACRGAVWLTSDLIPWRGVVARSGGSVAVAAAGGGSSDGGGSLRVSVGQGPGGGAHGQGVGAGQGALRVCAQGAETEDHGGYACQGWEGESRAGGFRGWWPQGGGIGGDLVWGFALESQRMEKKGSTEPGAGVCVSVWRQGGPGIDGGREGEGEGESVVCALKIVNKSAFWSRVADGKERQDTLTREILTQAVLTAHCDDGQWEYHLTAAVAVVSRKLMIGGHCITHLRRC
jgi:hypothetical protein